MRRPTELARWEAPTPVAKIFGWAEPIPQPPSTDERPFNIPSTEFATEEVGNSFVLYRNPDAWDEGDGHVEQSFSAVFPSQDSVGGAPEQFPRVGSTFLHFQLITQLGKGSFGRVFLAREEALAGREVVLKLSRDLRGEQQRLAQLQHSNIVPIYSVHQTDSLQAICMPYCGSVTLEDVLRDIKNCDSVPESGKALISTLNTKRTQKLGSSSSSGFSSFVPGSTTAPRPDSGISTVAAFGPSVPEGGAAITQLSQSGYVEAVLWMGARLADGLAYAHENGILHRDLKPANILLADNGQPMLLDFNLSVDLLRESKRQGSRIGGTVPYMAPEHLEAFATGCGEIDGRSDIYSLGLILYELLGGKHPFPGSSDHREHKLRELLEERAEIPPRVSRLNPAVTPAVDSIVQKCLEPHPADRYQSARELQHDIELHLADRPLEHAPEPSLRERAQKWVRRHPAVTSSTGVGTIAILLLASLAAFLWIREETVLDQEALGELGRFQAGVSEVEYALSNRLPEDDTLAEGIAQARNLLAHYQVLDNPAWSNQDLVQRLPGRDQERLRRQVRDLLILMARAESSRNPDSTQADQYRELAMVNVGHHRLDSNEELNHRTHGIQGYLEEESARDIWLHSAKLAAKGQVSQALQLATLATEKAPWLAQAWFIRGNCEYALGDAQKAESAYSSCLALNPKTHQVYFNRGLARMRLKNFAGAEADFTRVIELKRDLGAAYFHRSLARARRHQVQAALADLDRAAKHGESKIRVLFAKAKIHDQQNNDAAASQARAAAFQLTPKDAQDWLAYAAEHARTDPVEALANLDQALLFDPHCRQALRTKALLLAQTCRTEEAIDVLTHLLKVYPDYPLARATRGLLWARLGKRTEAHEDIDRALGSCDVAATRYLAACVYAQTSIVNDDDQNRALKMLASALDDGYGRTRAFRDPDLDPLRGSFEFRKLLGAAREFFITTR